MIYRTIAYATICLVIFRRGPTAFSSSFSSVNAAVAHRLREVGRLLVWALVDVRNRIEISTRYGEKVTSQRASQDAGTRKLLFVGFLGGHRVLKGPSLSLSVSHALDQEQLIDHTSCELSDILRFMHAHFSRFFPLRYVYTKLLSNTVTSSLRRRDFCPVFRFYLSPSFAPFMVSLCLIRSLGLFLSCFRSLKGLEGRRIRGF